MVQSPRKRWLPACTSNRATRRCSCGPALASGFLSEKSGRFENTPVAAMFLVSRSPAFMGNVIRYSDQLYATWGSLEDALRSGKPALPAQTYLGDDPARTRGFVQAMHERALGIARALVPILDLTGRRTMLDVGGGPGTYSVLLTERFPGLRAEVIELPGVAAVARELVAAAGASERVVLRDGDYHSADFGSGKDVVLMSGMFHRETEQACRGLIERAAACLNPGGLLVVSDVFTDQGGCQPTFAAMFGLNMMLTAPDGGVHADADVMRWMADIGFARPAHGAAAAADAAPCRDGREAMNRRHGLLAALGVVCGGLQSAGPRAGARATSPRVGELKSLGQDRYQIGRIVVDKRASSFTVPGRVHVVDKPLEYLATSPGGMKEYETLLEVDASGSEFNLACILIGLERDPKQAASQPAQPKPLVGPRVAISVAWSEGGKRRQVSAAEALLNPDAGVKPESVEWVYTGSPMSERGGSFRGRRHGDAGRLRATIRTASSNRQSASASVRTGRCAATRCCRRSARPSN